MAILCTSLVLLAVIAILGYIYLTWNNNYWKKRGIKGPKPKLFYGTQPSLITGKRNAIYDYLEHYNKYKANNKFIGIFTNRTPGLLILAPDLAKEIYTTKFRQFQDNFFSDTFDSKVEPLFGLNPFLLKGQEWKDKRAEITPGLTISRIKASYPVMQKVCSQMVDFIKNKNKIEGKGYVFDCKKLTQRFTIQNVSDCIYGIEAGAFDLKNDSELLKQAKNLINGLFESLGIMFIIELVPLLKNIWKVSFIKPEVKKFFTTLMRDAVELRKRNQTDRIDFLNYIMQLKDRKGLSDIELQAHSVTFFLDGFETSSTVLSHSLLCMGRNKVVQHKLRQEIEKHCDEDGTISFEKIMDLTYLDMCVNETLRLFMPGGFLQKVCTEDTELVNSDGTVLNVKKGMGVTLPLYCYHNDEEYYFNPNEYNPERFSPELGGEKKYRDIGAFMPFGDGPRTCLGQRFALTQIKIALCELVRNFDIDVDDKTRKDNLLDPKSFILCLDGGIWCTFKELKN
ncbi:probable cytochrome P450 28a5 [Condylostylus longicornis]|uniref:probable cytochrome P450 28a5 n=1 Tax=Condylostylus longicornis TaxID=2530218 RepID=UPI00244DF06D|nr:probable cytochrome P450 28a5 [Condylostylus longicornis]